MTPPYKALLFLNEQFSMSGFPGRSKNMEPPYSGDLLSIKVQL